MNPFGYPEKVWSLFQHPERAGVFGKGDTVVASATSNASNAVLELQAQFSNGQISEAKFRALGCPTTIAVGAWLADAITEGAELPGLDAATIREALSIPEDRAHCALLGEDAVRALQGKIGS